MSPFKLILDYSSYFSVDRIERNIIVSLRQNLPSEVVKEKSHLALTILAYPEGNGNLIASAVFIISLPVIEDAGKNLLEKLVFPSLNLVKYSYSKFYKTKLRWPIHDYRQRAFRQCE